MSFDVQPVRKLGNFTGNNSQGIQTYVCSLNLHTKSWSAPWCYKLTQRFMCSWVKDFFQTQVRTSCSSIPWSIRHPARTADRTCGTKRKPTVSAMALQTKSDQFAVRERQAATVLLNQSWAWRKFTPIQISSVQHVKAMEGSRGKPLELGNTHHDFGYPNLILVSLLAIEFSVNSGKHSTRTLGLVQNWVSAFHTQI